MKVKLIFARSLRTWILQAIRRANVGDIYDRQFDYFAVRSVSVKQTIIQWFIHSSFISLWLAVGPARQADTLQKATHTVCNCYNGKPAAQSVNRHKAACCSAFCN